MKYVVHSSLLVLKRDALVAKMSSFAGAGHGQ
jgi:hypothetical protein